MVTGFIKGIPKVIDNMIKGIPAFIMAIIKSIPDIIVPLINSLIFELGNPIFWVKIAITVAEAFIKSIPLIINNLISGIWDGISKMFGGGEGGFWDSIGLATGGKIVKGGIAGKDSVPAALMPGEVVIDKSLTSKLERSLNGQPQPVNNDITNALLNQVVNLLQKPTNVSTSVQLNNKTLADIILNLNRTNARLA
jgi:hypothetical protein